MMREYEKPSLEEHEVMGNERMASCEDAPGEVPENLPPGIVIDDYPLPS